MSKVFFGLSNVMISARTESQGTVSYAVPVALPGAVSLSIERDSETNDFYADNGKYWSSNSANSLTCELEMADLTRTFMTTYLSYTEASGGGYIQTTRNNDAAFALLFAVETDVKQRKCCLFNCTASEGDLEHATTEESVTPGTVTVNINCTGEALANGGRSLKLVSEQGDSNYATFFTAAPTVPTPSDPSF